MFDWNDLKALLAVARGGSTLAAARSLGVNQTTVARRIESLEAALSLKLVERGQTGSRLTQAGQDLLAEAERVERAADRFAHRAAGHQRGLAGAIRLTTTEIVANTMVTPALAEFRKVYPDVQVELVITDRALDLESGEADLAIRSGQMLQASDLVARKILDHEFALFCSRDYADRRGIPAAPEELRDHDLVAGEGEMGELPAVSWMLRNAGKAPVAKSNTMTNLVHAVRAGLGIGPLPTTIADLYEELVRCSDNIEEARVSSWVVTRRELKDTPRVRAFIDFVVPYLQQEVRQLQERSRVRRLQAQDVAILAFRAAANAGG